MIGEDGDLLNLSNNLKFNIMEFLFLEVHSILMAEFSPRQYKSFSLSKPSCIPDSIDGKYLGTYVVKHKRDVLDKDIYSYRIYHCKDINGTLVWYRLPSIKLIDKEVIACGDSIEALNMIYNELNLELKNLVDKLNKYYN